MGRKRKNPFVAMGIRARKKREKQKREESKRLARFKKMEIKTKKREAKAIAKAVAKIRKKEGLYN